MQCPQCAGPLKIGSISLTGSGGSILMWYDTPPEEHKLGKRLNGEPILKSDAFHIKKKHWLRKASYCEKCDIYTFQGTFEK